MSENRKLLEMNVPMWFDGKSINEALFCEDFLRTRQIIFANGAFFTPDGRVTDDLPLRGEIFEELKYCAVNNIPRKISNIIEIMKLAAHVEDFPPEQDRIGKRYAHAGRHFYRGEAGYCEKQAPGFLSPGYSETCAVAFLSEWSALPGGHPYLAGIYRLLPDSLQ